jgi:hypothetical protein
VTAPRHGRGLLRQACRDLHNALADVHPMLPFVLGVALPALVLAVVVVGLANAGCSVSVFVFLMGGVVIAGVVAYKAGGAK